MKAFAAFVVDKKKYVLVLYVLLIAAGIIGLFYTNVNYDMSKYLPSDSSVKEGMAVMDEEFGSLSSITVMFTGLDESERQTVRQALAQVEKTSRASPTRRATTPTTEAKTQNTSSPSAPAPIPTRRGRCCARSARSFPTTTCLTAARWRTTIC